MTKTCKNCGKRIITIWKWTFHKTWIKNELELASSKNESYCNKAEIKK